ncbi:uncharacterized protein B0I36DRAFT_26270 [Microdochium trichocladiopsis]|uniref:Uncharacterized protein n=1 Tax=Microdochium trichocladiopsis TaxID=1682393 RepID=A0A9P8XUV2_9PEZI|nr:uncharacterized protein B0I36DRAFT_26270 [Microdochium trichocladiopsis]KAH7020866.1 hypothetical protein B0I36DRAFT_26270 [Microdochium trichocladiopsis]
MRDEARPPQTLPQGQCVRTSAETGIVQEWTSCALPSRAAIVGEAAGCVDETGVVVVVRRGAGLPMARISTRLRAEYAPLIGDRLTLAPKRPECVCKFAIRSAHRRITFDCPCRCRDWVWQIAPVTGPWNPDKSQMRDHQGPNRYRKPSGRHSCGRRANPSGHREACLVAPRKTRDTWIWVLEPMCCTASGCEVLRVPAVDVPEGTYYLANFN